MLKELKWPPLKDRRRDFRLALLFKILQGEAAVETEGTLLTADSRTRSSHSQKFRHIAAKTSQYKNSFFVQTIPDWNTLPESCIKADTVTAFKDQLRASKP